MPYAPCIWNTLSHHKIAFSPVWALVQALFEAPKSHPISMFRFNTDLFTSKHLDLYLSLSLTECILITRMNEILFSPKYISEPCKQQEDMQTRRERITELLEGTEYPVTAEEICERLDIKKRSIVYEDIDHISKSVKRRGKELLIRPASCGKCQFVFKPRKTSKAPSKCPKCKSQWILAPAFLIRDTK